MTLVSTKDLTDIHAHIATLNREWVDGYIIAMLLSTGEVHTHEFKYLECAIEGLQTATDGLPYDVVVHAVVIL